MRVTLECDTVNSFPICNRADAQFGPAVAWNGENYVVVWSDRSFSHNTWWTTAARVSPQGALLDTGHVIGTQAELDEYYADVAFDGLRCLAVWYNSYYRPWGIYARFVNSEARPEDSVLAVASCRGYLYNFPKIDFGDSVYLVTWADLRPGETDYDIMGRLVTRDGRLPGAEVLIATGPGNQQRPDVCFDGSDFLVVWSEDGVIMGRRIGLDGVPLGPAFAVSDTTGNARSCPRVSAGSTGRLVTWAEQRGPETDIYGAIVARPGIQERSNRLQVAGSMFTFDIRHPANAKIYDRNGRRVKAENPGPGVYFIVSGANAVRKVVLVR